MCSFWKLLDEQDEHIKGFVERPQTMMERGWVVYAQRREALPLSPGRKNCRFLSPRQARSNVSPLSGRYNFHAFPEARELYSKLTEDRPLPDPRFDQGFMTQERYLRSGGV